MHPLTDRVGPAAVRTALALAAVGVLLAAADTYVVVLALPDMMVGVGLDVDELQRAAPLVSMFLLGYVVVLPLAGRISDVVGRLPVLLGALLVFAGGSLVTAAAHGLAEAVTGRFLQGAGGGALVPVTLALVADLWPPDRRGLPLGVVGAVQELGAVLGPLYGAVVLAVSDWRAIFWINLAAGLAVAAGIHLTRRATVGGNGSQRPPVRRDWLAVALAAGAVAAGAVALVRPGPLEQAHEGVLRRVARLLGVTGLGVSHAASATGGNVSSSDATQPAETTEGGWCARRV